MRIVTLSMLLILLLSGCAGMEESIKSAKLTVEPYELSVEEIQLVSKTGAGSIEYFKLNGKLDEGEVLAFSVETYEKGKLFNDELKSWGDHNGIYEDVLISFGISEMGSEHDTVNLMIGVPSGLIRDEYTNETTMYAMCKTIAEKLTIEKEKPAYVAIWKGTDGDSLSCSTTNDGGLPEWLDEADVAYLYKVLWTDEEKVED